MISCKPSAESGTLAEDELLPLDKHEVGMVLFLGVDGWVLNWLYEIGVDSTGYFNGGWKEGACSLLAGWLGLLEILLIYLPLSIYLEYLSSL